MQSFTITREIAIDMGHRVTNHHSKCRNLHGHRYTVQAVLEGELISEGSSEGMVLDFGFVKELMMEHIDTPCDHGMTLWVKDPLLKTLLAGETAGPLWDKVIENLMVHQYAAAEGICGKLYVVPFVPTVENLCRHWYKRLAKPIADACQGKGQLRMIRAWETPNGFAEYPFKSYPAGSTPFRCDAGEGTHYVEGHF